MQTSKTHRKSKKEDFRNGNPSGARHKEVQKKKESSGILYDPSQPYFYKAQHDKDPTVRSNKNKEGCSKYTSNINTRKDYKNETKFLSVQNLGVFGTETLEKSLEDIGAKRKFGNFPHSSTSASQIRKSTFTRESTTKRSETKNLFSSSYHCSNSSIKKVGVANSKKELPEHEQKVLHQDLIAQKDNSKKDSSEDQNLIAQKDKSKKDSSDDVTPNFLAVDKSINLTWNRRLSSGLGLINFESQNEFLSFQDSLKTKSISFMGQNLRIKQSKNNKYQFFVTNINPTAKVEDLAEVFQAEFPAIEPKSIELKFERAFETSDFELDYIKKQIEVKCHELKLGKFEVVVPKPKPSATIMKAYINVKNGENIDLAANRLSECSVSMPSCERNAKITARPVFRSLIKWDLDVCKAIDARMKIELAKLESELQTIISADDLFSVEMISTDATTAAIKMLTNNSDVMSELQKIINNLLEGEVLNESNFNYLDKFFRFSNDRVLKNLGEKESVLIRADPKVKIVRMYGLKENCLKAKENIQSLLYFT